MDFQNSKKSIRLSAVIITFNEERNIGRCIDSLLPVVDEFIIVDSRSTDGTEKEVQARGLSVLSHEWKGYSDSKNIGNAMATGDFILSIDADEALSPALMDALKTFKENPDSDVCEVNRLTNYCGRWIRHCGWYPEFKTRIFRNGIAKWKGTIHEELIIQHPYKSKKLNGDLLHFSYPTIESHYRKMFQYAKLAAEKKISNGRSLSLFWHGIVKPWWMFIHKYFIQLGFLDGFYGLVISINSALERFLRYAYYRQLKKSR